MNTSELLLMMQPYFRNFIAERVFDALFEELEVDVELVLDQMLEYHLIEKERETDEH